MIGLLEKNPYGKSYHFCHLFTSCLFNLCSSVAVARWLWAVGLTRMHICLQYYLNRTERGLLQVWCSRDETQIASVCTHHHALFLPKTNQKWYQINLPWVRNNVALSCCAILSTTPIPHWTMQHKQKKGIGIWTVSEGLVVAIIVIHLWWNCLRFWKIVNKLSRKSWYCWVLCVWFCW